MTDAMPCDFIDFHCDWSEDVLLSRTELDSSDLEHITPCCPAFRASWLLILRTHVSKARLVA
jgi:hypothetical protein